MNHWQTVIKAVKENVPSCWSTNAITVEWPNTAQYPPRSWLTHIWEYRRCQLIPLRNLVDIPLIPVNEQRRRFLYKLKTQSLLMLGTYHRNSLKISTTMRSFLSSIGIKFVEENNVDVHALQVLSEGQYLLLPDGNGIINALINVNNTGYNLLSAVNNGSVQVKEEILQSIDRYPYGLPSFMRGFNLFKTFHTSTYTSSNSCKLVDESIVPNEWNSKFGVIVLKESISVNIQTKFNFVHWDFKDVVTCILNYQHHLTTAQQDSLYYFIVEHIANVTISGAFTQHLRECIYITSDGTRKKPCDLFQKSETLTNFFLGEKNKFPDACFDVCALMKLGLKQSELNITAVDVSTSINNIAKLYAGNNLSHDQLVLKVKTILEVAIKIRCSLVNFVHLKWIPIETKPSLNYPKSLKWFGSDAINRKQLETPKAAYLPSHGYLVGSVCNIINSSIADLLPRAGLTLNPAVNLVIQHLINIADGYNDDERGSYKEEVLAVYKYLSSCDVTTVASQIIQKEVKIWTGTVFVESKRILLNRTSCDVSPYYYYLPSDVTKCFNNVLTSLGCGSKSEVSIYMDVLSKMEIKHRTSAAEDWVYDLKMALQLVTFLADNVDKINDAEILEMYVPIDCSSLKFCKVKDCLYHNFEGCTTYSSISTYNVLHRTFSEDVAHKLGVPDLVSQLLSGEESTIFESWGQHELLTLRLNKLLKDYKDGLPIPKELIQNADDAGASKVYFLYDERNNNDLKSSLFDRGMKDWQGPALWVYNNQMFKEEDFMNITKLNAGTKENDTMKIGKFGLGFNAVYHLTDVPSFLSGDSLVVFDPHTKYLGKALRNKLPGVRIRVCKNKVDFVKFNDQFKVFDGVFGAQMDFASNVEHFNGTLFRFPLRNAKTAKDSKINGFEYTDYEMKLLLRKIEESINQLLLFTENVKEVKVFNLHKNACSPSEMVELFSVNKIMESQGSTTSILCSANTELTKKVSYPNYIIPTVNFLHKVDMKIGGTNVPVVNEKWLVSSVIGSQESFNFACNNKGFSPCGGVAVQYEVVEEGKLDILSDSGNSHMFCFLPLPLKSHLPVNVNGAFAVSKDRKQLTRSTEDEKRYGLTKDWNDLLGKDIGQAYLNLLLEWKSMCPGITLDDWFKIFPSLPLPEENSCILELVKSFISKLVLGDDEIFPVSTGITSSKWIKWRDIVILPTSISGQDLDCTIKYMNWYFSKENISNVCVDVPNKFRLLLVSLGFDHAVKQRLVTEGDFYAKFFKYLDHCDLDSKIRNHIMLYLLKKQPSSGYLKELLVNQACIPTKPNGVLRKPSQLVKYGSKASMLYDIEDNVFPCDEFHEHFVYLESLGMAYHSLNWENLLERTKSVEAIKKSKGLPDAVCRSKLLMQFIKESYPSCPAEIKSELLKTPFLTVCKKPECSLSMNWYGEKYDFSSPNNMFSLKFVNIASCCHLVCEDQFDNELSTFLTLDRDIPFEVVKQQLNEVVSTYEHNGIILRQILCDVYGYLSKFDKCQLKELQEKNIIYTDKNKLAKPSQVYESIEQELPGYMYRLPSDLKYTYMPILTEIGVKSASLAIDYVTALKKIRDEKLESPITEELLNPILHSVVPFLCKEEAEVLEQHSIYLPDKNCMMQDVKDMSFKDATWFDDEEGVIYAHEDIPPVFCLILQVKSVRDSFMFKNAISLPFGQHEKLTTRIKNLLHGYSQKEDVLKEILQNADDAGATEVEFLLDLRTHHDERVFSDKWKALQGPALLVSNNGKFTSEDLEAIQTLGEGNKSKEVLKTGKYGVGFNAVYHITDCPSFFTSIEGEGDVLCIFDPNLLYAEGATKECPGIKLKDARSHT